MRLLIGIDDTDNLTSIGTGKLVRRLGLELIYKHLAQLAGITRHQLLVSPEIPFTSHNSSACMMVETDTDKVDKLTDYCREFLLKNSASGSDAGLCLAEWDKVNLKVQTFGKLAKEKVLTQKDAVAVAQEAGLFLEGLTGTKGGIIGALAGVGLRKSGNDGRFIWLPGLYELEGIYTAHQLYQNVVGVDRIQDLTGKLVSEDTRIQVNRWPRPVLLNGQIIMLVAKATDEAHEIKQEDYEYQMAPKNIIRQY
ncbi:ABC transporter substrate-binding protein [Scytonema sp. UIC 10036]|uniref:ABC transporter substrate-binding protein n=1 Tax=Scytonema sp. UIC 10036 TaxID=2304196 RepID=UPI0012DA402B|nr:ABC transporter substrate-binding protein [Scytonema sp. UIC 10036]MUG93497.1 ABC transporter substrate-binding protein [Scytonema sp. UIC 10036]